MKPKSLIIYGSYPPPVGGVSTHIQRAIQLVQKADLFQHVKVLDNDYRNGAPSFVEDSKFFSSIFFLLMASNNVVHFHQLSWKTALLMLCASFRNKTLLTIHNERIKSGGTNWKRWGWLITLCFKKLSHIIVVNSNAKQELVRMQIEQDKVSLIPAYIPQLEYPQLTDADIQFYQKVSEIKEQHDYLIVALSSYFRFHDRQELYGTDMLVQLMKHLKESGLSAACVIVVPNPSDWNYLDALESTIQQLGLSKSILLNTEPVAIHQLWQMGDLMVRPTNTDGNAISILEALSIELPVVASDCVERHDSVVLFKNRNQDSLNDTVSGVLGNLADSKREIKASIPDYGRELIMLLKNISK